LEPKSTAAKRPALSMEFTFSAKLESIAPLN
jgi:hypothetical protein